MKEKLVMFEVEILFQEKQVYLNYQFESVQVSYEHIYDSACLSTVEHNSVLIT